MIFLLEPHVLYQWCQEKNNEPKEPPSLREAFAEVRREENRKCLMMPENRSSVGQDTPGMVTQFISR